MYGRPRCCKGASIHANAIKGLTRGKVRITRQDRLADQLGRVFSQRYERGSILVTSNLPFDEWTEVFGSERLTGALLDRLTHHVHILEMNGESFRLKQSKTKNKNKT